MFIVTQSSIGGSLKTALDGFLGRYSAVYGGGIVFLIPHGRILARAVALAIAVAPVRRTWTQTQSVPWKNIIRLNRRPLS